MTSETVDILLRAADRVEFKGWCQGALAEDTHGRPTNPLLEWEDEPEPESSYDSVGAVRWSGAGAIRIDSGNKDVEWRHLYAEGRVERLLGNLVTFADWNDIPGRTAAEVAHLLRASALECLWPGGPG